MRLGTRLLIAIAATVFAAAVLYVVFLRHEADPHAATGWHALPSDTTSA